MSLLKRVRVLRRIVEVGYTMLIVVLLSIIVGLFLAFPVMWLWNFVFGDVHHINVFQAWALNILAGILFSKGSEGPKG